MVSFCDQWYIKYGESEWQKQISNHLNSKNFNPYNENIKNAFVEAIEWLSDWGISRTYGMGSRVPWDPKFVIESLSDSTIYMAYYTVSRHLQGI